MEKQCKKLYYLNTETKYYKKNKEIKILTARIHKMKTSLCFGREGENKINNTERNKSLMKVSNKDVSKEKSKIVFNLSCNFLNQLPFVLDDFHVIYSYILDTFIIAPLPCTFIISLFF